MSKPRWTKEPKKEACRRLAVPPINRGFYLLRARILRYLRNFCDVYFTSDLHFGHELVLKKYPNFRKGANVAEMDENLIAAWNALVTPEDIVYDLGDVSFS